MGYNLNLSMPFIIKLYGMDMFLHIFPKYQKRIVYQFILLFWDIFCTQSCIYILMVCFIHELLCHFSNISNFFSLCHETSYRAASSGGFGFSCFSQCSPLYCTYRLFPAAEYIERSQR